MYFRQERGYLQGSYPVCISSFYYYSYFLKIYNCNLFLNGIKEVMLNSKDFLLVTWGNG